MTTQRTLLVTGGGGFLGGAIVRQLVGNAERVRSFSRGRYPDLEALGVEQVQGDLADADAVKRACEGVEAVFHVAAKPGVWGPYETYHQANVTGTQNVIDACRQCGVRRLIHTSSPSVVFDGRDMEGVDESVPYPDHYEAHYPRTKALAEQAVLAAARQGLPAVALRPHLIWGPGDNHLAPRLLARARRLRRVGDGTNKVDTIYIDNAAHAHVLAEARLRENPALSGRVYFISQDHPIPLWDMVDHILAAGGLPPVRKTISPTMATFAGAAFETIYKLLGIRTEPPMTRFVAGELATAHWFNIAAAKRDLGYTPLVSTEEGLRRLTDWLARRHG
ncbi:MAG: NAD-dependent epimerase/dehydratase family protein [Desulfatitalea sp.]|nr:NAD-dependent epimerase/dehydratase family protein [Desulfatitalea sp.]